jgi:hypothetical protein
MTRSAVNKHYTFGEELKKDPVDPNINPHTGKPWPVRPKDYFQKAAELAENERPSPEVLAEMQRVREERQSADGPVPVIDPRTGFPIRPEQNVPQNVPSRIEALEKLEKENAELKLVLWNW